MFILRTFVLVRGLSVTDEKLYSKILEVKKEIKLYICPILGFTGGVSSKETTYQSRRSGRCWRCSMHTGYILYTTNKDVDSH